MTMDNHKRHHLRINPISQVKANKDLSSNLLEIDCHLDKIKQEAVGEV